MIKLLTGLISNKMSQPNPIIMGCKAELGWPAKHGKKFKNKKLKKIIYVLTQQKNKNI